MNGRKRHQHARPRENHRHRGAFHLAQAARADRAARRPDPAEAQQLAGVRIKEMDDAGIDLAVLSENAPAANNLPPDVAVMAARASNDFLHETIRAHPGRFAGFATLPLPDPKASADELERCVTKLGFHGAMVMGTSHGLFLDDKRFRPIFERASARRADLHPPVADAARGAGGLFPGPCRAAAGPAARLGHRDADAFVPADHLGRARRISRHENHHRPSSARWRRSRCGGPTTTSRAS